VGADFLQALGWPTQRLEREFNRRAGFTAADGRLPLGMTRVPLTPHTAVFDVSESELDVIFAEI
jgi:aldehyde:ferredoxin oxidoreductase